MCHISNRIKEDEATGTTRGIPYVGIPDKRGKRWVPLDHSISPVHLLCVSVPAGGADKWVPLAQNDAVLQNYPSTVPKLVLQSCYSHTCADLALSEQHHGEIVPALVSSRSHGVLWSIKTPRRYCNDIERCSWIICADTPKC